MPIGTDLTHRLASRALATLDTRIGTLQGNIASGRNDPRASADPGRAATLSAATEQRARVEGFERATESAGIRLAQTDTALAEALDVLRRLRELGLAAASDTTSPADRGPIQAEVLQLRKTLIDIGNRRDGEGRALFAGTANPETAFRDTPQGVVYAGNGARPSARVSESLRLETGVPGNALLTDLPGVGSVFALAEDLAATLGVALERSRTAGGGSLPTTLELDRPAQPSDLRLTLAGPLGRAEIHIPAHTGDPAVLAGAISAVSAQTGVQATLAGNGAIALEGNGTVEIGPVTREGPPLRAALMRLAPATGPGIELRDARLDNGALAARLGEAHDAVVGQRARLGAMAAAAERQADTLAARRLALEQAVSGLETLDIAAAVTELQSLLLTRQAAQQTHARISARTLFDYL